ncbi:uncharacterized protein LOC116439881 [Corvus moneduloides]|uniref:uncharacterized protein LOC116439881 n=1 Tax=Corvus moneduloides TaxID=1196302 RepID=UPI001362F899|nr:uncharacterized protein LOC116439881 [Corvus moneduloides]
MQTRAWPRPGSVLTGGFWQTLACLGGGKQLYGHCRTQLGVLDWDLLQFSLPVPALCPAPLQFWCPGSFLPTSMISAGTGGHSVLIPSSLFPMRSGAGLVGTACPEPTDAPPGRSRMFLWAGLGCSSGQERDVPAGRSGMSLQAGDGCSCRQERDVPPGRSGMFLQAGEGCPSRQERDVPAGRSGMFLQAGAGCSSRQEMDVPAGRSGMSLQAGAGCSCRQERDVPAGRIGMFLWAGAGCPCRQERDVPAGRSGMFLQAGEGCSCRQERDVPAGRNGKLFQAGVGCSCRQERDVPAGTGGMSLQAGVGCSSRKEWDVPAGRNGKLFQAGVGCSCRQEREALPGRSRIPAGKRRPGSADPSGSGVSSGKLPELRRPARVAPEERLGAAGGDNDSSIWDSLQLVNPPANPTAGSRHRQGWTGQSRRNGDVPEGCAGSGQTEPRWL